MGGIWEVISEIQSEEGHLDLSMLDKGGQMVKNQKKKKNLLRGGARSGASGGNASLPPQFFFQTLYYTNPNSIMSYSHLAISIVRVCYAVLKY